MTKETAKKESEESNRMWASASFVGVLIIIGLPLWWKTTEVYRVALPYDKIEEFDSLSHYVTAELTILANDDATAAEIAGLVENAFKDSDVIKLKITKSTLSEQLHQALESVTDEHEAIEEVAAKYPLGNNKLYLVQRRPLFQEVWLGSERVMFFRDDKAAPTAVSALKQWVYQTHILHGARAVSADESRRVRFPPAAEYRILVHTDYELNMEKEFYDYIGSFADELSELHNFTITMQSMYMLNFDYHAQQIKDTSEHGRHFAISKSTLPLLLTKLEETAPRVPSRAAINLALCRVPCGITPLYIYGDDDKPTPAPIQAFMSPKWGGVVFHNPSQIECESGEWKTDARLVMGAFVAQLRALLGIVDTESIPGAYLEPLRSVSPRQWEVDTLHRIRTLEQITSAERTLQSLAQLLGEISNIVINDEVGASINSAVQHTNNAATLAREGRLEEAYRTSLQGAADAETAFMEPSLLALLYFPDDQKYAIYIPLFLPIMFPVFLSLRYLVAWTRGKPLHKQKTD